MKKVVTLAAVFSVLLLCARLQPQNAHTCPSPVLAIDTDFVPGQIWSFQGRPFEPTATITVLKVESLPKIGTFIHVRIDGIILRNCKGGGEPHSIQHAPFAKAALLASHLKLVRSGVVPNFEEGYRDWRDHCGGVYTIPVQAVIEADEKTLNAGSGCTS